MRNLVITVILYIVFLACFTKKEPIKLYKSTAIEARITDSAFIKRLDSIIDVSPFKDMMSVGISFIEENDVFTGHKKIPDFSKRLYAMVIASDDLLMGDELFDIVTSYNKRYYFFHKYCQGVFLDTIKKIELVSPMEDIWEYLERRPKGIVIHMTEDSTTLIDPKSQFSLSCFE